MFNFKNLNSKQQGFTLIELIFVMFIIGMAVSMFTLSVGDANRGQKLKQQSRILYKSIELAVEEASFNRLELGLRFDPYFDEGNNDQYQYQWLVYSHEKRLWFLLESEELVKTILLPGLNLEITIEGNAIILGEEKDSEDAIFAVNDEVLGGKIPVEPDIYFLSSGEMPEFTIALSDKEAEFSDDSAYRIKGNFIGQLTYLLPGQDDES